MQGIGLVLTGGPSVDVGATVDNSTAGFDKDVTCHLEGGIMVPDLPVTVTGEGDFSLLDPAVSLSGDVGGRGGAGLAAYAAGGLGFSVSLNSWSIGEVQDFVEGMVDWFEDMITF